MTAKYENQKLKQGYTHVIGCDEVGRGSLAGPVVSAAVVLPLTIRKWAQIRDSKLLSPEKREELADVIKQNCVGWGIGLVEHTVIDKINIHYATLRAMRMAVENLLATIHSVILNEAERSEESQSWKRSFGLRPQDDAERVCLVIDGKFTIPDIEYDQEAIVEGDNKVLSIAAASIIAKVYRDNLMREYHKQYPIYNFAQHKGYATLFHRRAIIKNGISPIHRLSFCDHLV